MPLLAAFALPEISLGQWPTIVICRVRLRVKLVHKRCGRSVLSKHECHTILPDGIFSIVTTPDKIALVLVDVMDALISVREWFSENHYSVRRCKNSFEIAQRLIARASIPRRRVH